MASFEFQAMPVHKIKHISITKELKIFSFSNKVQTIQMQNLINFLNLHFFLFFQNFVSCFW